MDTICDCMFFEDVFVVLHDILFGWDFIGFYFCRPHGDSYRVLGIFSSLFFELCVFQTSDYLLQFGNLQDTVRLCHTTIVGHVYTCVGTI